MAPARPQSYASTYEASPDGAKALLGRIKIQEGKIVTITPDLNALLEEHKMHLVYLNEGALPPRNLILPLPYPPSTIDLLEANRVYINNLRINSRNANDIIILRTITDPYVHSSSITIVEDEQGNFARLTLCNVDDSVLDPVLAKDSIITVKQPCWSVVADRVYHICVDHPSDLVFLRPNEELVPTTWRRAENPTSMQTALEWKQKGDSMFLEKNFRKALECYENGRLLLIDGFNPVAQIEIYRKRCNVNIVLLRFDAAAEDLAQAMFIHAKSSHDLQISESVNISAVRSWLHSPSREDPLDIISHIPRPLKNLATRIKLDIGLCQDNPDYDFNTLSSHVSPLNLHIDTASYIRDTEVRQTAGHGRGLFAKRDYKAGDLVMTEKAFALPIYFENDKGSECSLYSLGDGTATDRAGALLFRELVQKLDANPSMRKLFFDMDDGGYWAQNGYEVADKDVIPVDVFRIEHIRRRNCFAAPTRTIDVLNIPNTPVRNGFWIHTSYINHSCLPNSVRTFVGDLLLLRATRDISAGEEITAQYTTPGLTFADRQQTYKGTWGFACDCQLCEVDMRAGKEGERQRIAVFEELKCTTQRLGSKPPTVTALKKFAKRLRELQALYDVNTYAHLPKLCLVHPTLFLTEAWRGLKNTDRMMESADKLLRHFGIVTRVEGSSFIVVENSGLVNIECVRALKYLCEGYALKGPAEVADSIMVIAKVWFRIITGADVGNDDFLRL